MANVTCNVDYNPDLVSSDVLQCRNIFLDTLDKALVDDPNLYERIPQVITRRYKVSDVEKRVATIRNAPLKTKMAARRAEKGVAEIKKRYAKDGGKFTTWGDGTFLNWLMENLPQLIQTFMTMFAACGL